MRLSVYISEVVKVNQLSDMVETAKQENPSHQITGVLSYNHGYYLHIIEGNTAKVKAFDIIIRKDPRHKNIRKVFNFETKKRYFSNWSINLAPLLQRNESFLSVVNQLNRHVNSTTYETRRLFSIFHPLAQAKVEVSNQINVRDHLAYSINEWPDFKKIEASSSLMSLCGSLMCKPTCFRTIVTQNAHESKATLRAMLSQLNEAGYLKVEQVSEETKQSINSIKANHKRDGLLNSLEKFGKISFKLNFSTKAAA